MFTVSYCSSLQVKILYFHSFAIKKSHVNGSILNKEKTRLVFTCILFLAISNNF